MLTCEMLLQGVVRIYRFVFIRFSRLRHPVRVPPRPRHRDRSPKAITSPKEETARATAKPLMQQADL